MSNASDPRGQPQETTAPGASREAAAAGEGSSSTGSAINPLNWPDHLRQYGRGDAGDPGSAQDPHTWEDPDPGILERLTPDTTAGWLWRGSFGLVILGLVLYLFPIFGQVYRDPITTGLMVLVGLIGGTYLKGRVDAVETFQEIDWSIVDYGDRGEVRPGETVDDSGREIEFTPWTTLTLGALGHKVLQKRHLPYDPSKLRSTRGDAAGEESVVDRLNTTTTTIYTDTIGTVHVTHAGDLDDDFQADSDRYTTLPNTIDEAVVDDVNELLTYFQRHVQSLQAEIEGLETSNEKLREKQRQEATRDFERAVRTLERLREATDTNRTRNEQQNAAQAGAEILRDAAEKAEQQH